MDFSQDNLVNSQVPNLCTTLYSDYYSSAPSRGNGQDKRSVFPLQHCQLCGSSFNSLESTEADEVRKITQLSAQCSHTWLVFGRPFESSRPSPSSSSSSSPPSTKRNAKRIVKLPSLQFKNKKKKNHEVQRNSLKNQKKKKKERPCTILQRLIMGLIFPSSSHITNRRMFSNIHREK